MEYPAAHLSWSGSRFGRPEWLSYKKGLCVCIVLLKTLDKLLVVWYLIDKGNLPTSYLIFLNLFFRLIAQILVRVSFNFCYSLIAVIGEIRDGNY